MAMRDDLWNLFMETGSVDAFLDYKNFVTFGEKSQHKGEFN